MARDWESSFSSWAKPPSQTEQDQCDNAERAIRDAIRASDQLRARDIRIFAQGSYRNRVNVRRDSDVDIGVCCYDVFFPDYPEGTSGETFGLVDSNYSYAIFKNEVEIALVNHFRRAAVTRGNKAFDIKENTYRVEADVAPFFEHRRYSKDGRYLSGVELRTDNSLPLKVINWPQQHYDNGVAKNQATHQRYKALVRIIKTLRNEMEENGSAAGNSIPGFLIECLVWNVPNSAFGHTTYKASVREALASLFNNTMTEEKCTEWGEVSELNYLFRGTSPWTREQAHAFISAAWDYIGFD